MRYTHTPQPPARSGLEKDNRQILVRCFEKEQTPESRLSLRESRRSFAEQKTTYRRLPSAKRFSFPAAALLLCSLLPAGIAARPAVAAPPVSAAPSDNPNTTTPLTASRQGGPVELTVAIDKATAQIAEPITLTLTVQAPEQVTVSLPPQPATLGPFTVLHVSDALDLPTAGGRQSVRQYQLECLTAGPQTVPAIAVSYTDRRSEPTVSELLESPTLQVNIASVLEGTPDPLAFRDLKDVVELPEEPPTSYAWLAWSLGAAAVLSCAGAALLLWPHRRSSLPPGRWALAELAALEESDLVAAGETERFYVRLTDIVRQFIERRFEIGASTLTTAEFLDQATRREALGPDQQRVLKEFLSQADLVKFARFQPNPTDAAGAIDVARQFVVQAAEPSPATPSPTTPSPGSSSPSSASPAAPSEKENA
ncbi:DUF4381 family protein [Lignipirellula cremea]|uniref:Uncharacterized protein n=1 Tax=Lignipirellula cremea TaxID=2528010 RepID=A0A518E4S7_9BACT|nr:DUF4381 family protein [Lignipirellula cremea]QDU99101.1 hypothetical protein Pla8534_70120 [Lignipirellula cremea]